MGRMKLKNTSKKRKKRKFKYFIYLFIIYYSFSYSFYNFMKNSKSITNEEFINMLVSGGNANMIKKYKVPNVVNTSMIYLLNIDFRNPKSILNATILGDNEKNKRRNIINLKYDDDYSDMEELKEVSSYIKDPNPKKVDDPIVYIYNSHQLENYSNDNLDIYGITPNVLMASYLLREKLSERGINSIVEEANMSEILEKNHWNYAYSYVASRSLIEDNILKHPTLKYFIDIHRDSINREASTINIDNVKYAKVLFVIGKDYSTWEENYKLANSLNDIINKYYPNLSRGIITKTGMNVNGVYNQDLNSNVILIEVGGVDNSIDDVNNTISALARILSIYIKGE